MSLSSDSSMMELMRSKFRRMVLPMDMMARELLFVLLVVAVADVEVDGETAGSSFLPTTQLVDDANFGS